jgi:subtilase family serine protease
LPTVVIDGSDPGINGDEVEALLDTEIAGGIAPKAKIYLYTSEGGLGSSMVRALDDNIVSILNISFSGCEAGEGNSGNAFLLAWAEQAAAQGISVTVSTGDSGSANCDSEVPAARFGLAVNGIASTPWTIAVGGTDFSTLPANFSTYVATGSTGSAPYYRTAKIYIPEAPWNDSTTVNTSISANVPYKNASGNTNMAAAGGGASSCVTQNSSNNCLGGYLKPSFQTSLTPNDSVRDLPDVSLFSSNGFDQAVWTVCADNVAKEDTSSTYTDCQTTNGQLTSSSTFSGYGGTSTSAPAFAGMLALVSQAQGGARLGQADFVLYQLAKSKLSTIFHDTTVGDNSVACVSGSPNCGSNGFMTGYNATAGYDQALGLGSVDASAMVKNWSSVSLAFTSTTLNINGSNAAVTAAHGTPITFNVAVTPSSASGVAGIVDTGNATPGGPLLNGQFGIPLADGSGSETYNGMPGGTYTVAARYGGDTSDAASTSSPINVTISPENSAVAIAGSGCFPPPLSTLCIGLSPGSGNLSLTYGSSIRFGAQIAGTSADEVKNGTQGVATGTVTFASGSTILETVPVDDANQVSWRQLSC